MELQFRLEHPARPRPPRTRVSLACQRCKIRKQRCDGARPSCSNCRHSKAPCEYIAGSNLTTLDHEHLQYTKLLERRVAELESVLTSNGLTAWGQDHWDPSGYSSNHTTVQPNSESANLVDSPRQSEVDSIVHVLRDLSLEASGGYVGPSSTITIGRMVKSILKVRQDLDLHSPVDEYVGLNPKSTDDGVYMDSGSGIHSSSISSKLADKLLKGYFKHVSTKFPVIHTAWLRDVHSRRAALVDDYEKAILNLAYALGGRFLESIGEAENFYPALQHQAALENFDEIMQYHDIRAVVLLLLLGIYCLRSPRSPGAWTYVGLAMRLCIDLGLHRKASIGNKSDIETEMKKRIFWTAYCLDRQISLALGRPFAIADHDIDVELPLDIDEAEQDSAVIQQAANAPVVCPSATSTSMSSFIHLTKLKIIESQIQRTIYRVDQMEPVADAETDYLFELLESWKSKIPLDSARQKESEFRFFDGYDYYMAFYYKSVRLLLYPQLSRPDVPLRFVKECAKACGGVCESYKRLHHCSTGVFSPMSLQSVFNAANVRYTGLTLIYCLWISPQEIFNVSTSNNLSSCSVLLYLISERWHGARKYRDAFEGIKIAVLDLVAQGGHNQSRKTIQKLHSELRATIEDVQMNIDDSSQVVDMMNAIVGESWNQHSPEARPVAQPNMSTDLLADPDLFAQVPGNGQDHIPTTVWGTMDNTSLGQLHWTDEYDVDSYLLIRE